MKTAAGCAVLLLLLVAACSADAPQPPSVTDAWIRAAPPTARMHAGYLTIVNPSATALRVVGARSPDFDSIEIHQTIVDDGVARMRALPEVDVPARGRAVFEPGGRHLMLFGARRELARGDAVQLILELADAAPLTITATVGDGPASGAETP
jgi:copper(I)-binding protein